MASLKIVLRKKQNTDGTYPLAIRVTKDRKSSYIHLGHSLHMKDWNAAAEKVRSSYPNHARLNNFILKRKSEANDTFIALETSRKDTSSITITKEIKPKEGTSFFMQADMFLDNMRKQGKYNRVLTETSRLKNFRTFLDNQDVEFPEITVPLLNRFRAYLIGAKGIAERTVVNHLILIRTIYNQAIAGNVADVKHYPFGKGKISIKLPESLKVGLSVKEIVKLTELDLSDKPYLNHARNIWLVSFYFAGMRISDVLRMKWTDFQDDRLYYTMGKNLKPGSLQVPQKALTILRQYESHEKKNDLVFPELKALDRLDSIYDIQRKISYATKRLNDALAEIANHQDVKLTKKLTMHIARHSFGNISRDKMPIQVLQKLYRHTDIKTTMGYQSNFIHKQADDALDAVLDF